MWLRILIVVHVEGEVAMVRGTWQIIQWCPDLVTQEWLNIGVGFRSNDCQHFQYLDHLSKIECVYGKEVADHADAVIKLTKQFFEKKFYTFSPQIKLVEIGVQKGESVQDNLKRSYKRVVTFGKH